MSNSYRFRQLAFGLLVALFTLTLSSSASAQEFKRKVVFEEFTGTWCMWCPVGAWVLDSMHARMGDALVEFAWHVGDDMEIPPAKTLAEVEFGIPGYPTGIQNRRYLFGNYNWSLQNPWYTYSVADARLAPEVDVRITNVKAVGTKIDFDVEVSPLNLATMAKEDTCKYALFVAMTEDDIVQDQQYINGEILMDFVHRNVARRVSTGTQGDVFVMGTKTAVNTYPIKKHYTITALPNWKMDKLRLKTFVSRRSNKAANGQYIMNADQTAYVATMPEDAPNAVWTVTPAEDAELDGSKPASIIWSKQGSVTKAKLDYSTNGGTNWEPIAAEVTSSPFAWTIPASALGQTAIIRITDASSAGTSSISKPFMIVAPITSEITVLQPSAGEVLRPGSTYMIEFMTSGEVGTSRVIEYSTDGTVWKSVATVANSATTYSWKVPTIEAQNVQVRVTSGAIKGLSGSFSILAVGAIQSLSVHGGVTPVPQNTSVEITWTASGELGSTFDIEYSDGGQVWSTLQADVPSGLRSYTWVTPDMYVPQASVRIRSASGATRTSVAFAIGTPASVKLTGVPTSNAIASSYPNPFSSTSSIVYHIAQAGDVMLTVRDILGKDVVTLESGMHQAGAYSTEVSAKDLVPGTYVVTLSINGETYSRTISVTK